MSLKKIDFVLAGICLTTLIVGCRRTEEVSPTAQTEPRPLLKIENTPLPESMRLKSDDESLRRHPAELVVERFLEAMFQGQEETVRSYLTATARRKGEKMGIPFSFRPNPSATFTLHGTAVKGDVGAYVQTTLEDVDDQGHRESAEIVWVVASTTEGWRVAGAAVSLFAGQEKTVLSFEDPGAAQQAIDEAIDRERQRKIARNH